MADDPTWDESHTVQPDAEATPSGAAAPADGVPDPAAYVPYQPPTRRQMREAEARAKARENGTYPLVQPPAPDPRPVPGAAAAAAAQAAAEAAAAATAPVPPAPAADATSSSPVEPAAQAAPPVAASEPVAADAAPKSSVSSSTQPPAPAVVGAPLASTGGDDMRRPDDIPGSPATVEDLFSMDSQQQWPLSQEATPKKRKRRRFIWLWVLLGLLAIGAGGAATVWVLFEEQVRSVLGWEIPNDYEGTGNGEAITVTVVSGEIGSDIADSLAEAGVTMTPDAFYDLLVSMATQPNFMPGTYQLQGEMSAASALAALQDPANLVVSSVVLPEGIILPAMLQRLSDGTGVPLADFEAVAADYTSLGIPADAPSAEGFLFPATYSFEPGLTAQQILQTMADRMTQSLDAAGVAPEDRLRVLTFAALVQKESGSVEDMYKIARVFQNRLDTGELLRSDASIAYGTGNVDSINTTTEEQQDTSNLYNTYALPGLPIGPISAPGDDAIDSVLNPADGSWLFFCLVNPETGETKFTNTYPEHLEAVAELAAWAEDYEARTGSPYNFDGSRGDN